jgi:hypothetical protein
MFINARFKMLWKFLRSDEKVAQALEQSATGYNLSPDAPTLAVPANNDEPPLARRHAKSRLWLEDWSERDEARLQSDNHIWEGYTG